MTFTLTSHDSSAASSATPSRQPSFGNLQTCKEQERLDTSSFPGNCGRKTGSSLLSPSSSDDLPEAAFASPADADSDKQELASQLGSTIPCRRRPAQHDKLSGLQRATTFRGLPPSDGPASTDFKYGSLASLAGPHSPQFGRRVHRNGLRANTFPMHASIVENQLDGAVPELPDDNECVALGSTLGRSSDIGPRGPRRQVHPCSARPTLASSPSTVHVKTRLREAGKNQDHVLLTPESTTMSETVDLVRSTVIADSEGVSPAVAANSETASHPSVKLSPYRFAHVGSMTAGSSAEPDVLYMSPLVRSCERY